MSSLAHCCVHSMSVGRGEAFKNKKECRLE